MNEKLKIYMKKKHAANFFNDLCIEYNLVLEPICSDLYKEAFKPDNTVKSFKDELLTMEFAIGLADEISSCPDDENFFITFYIPEGKFDAFVAYKDLAVTLRKILELSRSRTGYLDNTLIIISSGEVLCISRDEYDYSIINSKSEYFKKKYDDMARLIE